MSPPPSPSSDRSLGHPDGSGPSDSALADFSIAEDSEGQTQPFTQPIEEIRGLGGVKDEEGEGVWGYLIGLQGDHQTIVLKDRTACPGKDDGLNIGHGDESRLRDGKDPKVQEEKYEEKKTSTCCTPAGGYLIGRSKECGRCPLHRLRSYDAARADSGSIQTSPSTDRMFPSGTVWSSRKLARTAS